MAVMSQPESGDRDKAASQSAVKRRTDVANGFQAAELDRDGY